MRLRPSDALKAISALVALATLLFGVPAALAVGVGWPLPTVVPDLSDIRIALTSGAIDDRTILKAIALVIWLAWTQVALSAISEFVAVRRRRTAAPTPLTFPGVQLLVGRLLSAALLLSVLLQTRSTAPVAARLIVASVQATDEHLARPEASPAPSATVTWTVQPRETLWGIAERALGDGRRFQEIADLNRGRLQPDGATFESPHVIRPGWVLQLPIAEPLPPVGPEHIVVPGESLSAVAEARLGDLDRWPELWELNRGRVQPDGGALSGPDLIEPGWTLRLPAVDADPGADGPAVVPPEASDVEVGLPSDPPLTPTTSEPVERSEEIDEDGAEGESGFSIELLLAGTGAASVLALLERRRRVAWRRRRRHEDPGVGPEDVQIVERRLRAAARAGLDGRLDAAVRLAMSAGSSSIAFAAVSAGSVRVWPVGDEVPPPLFEVNGNAWVTLASKEELLLATGDGPAVMPALVSIGMTADAELHVDLEHLGSASVSGPADDVAGLLRAIALTLEASGVRTITVGLGTSTGSSWDAVVQEMESHVESLVRSGTESSIRDARAEGAEGVEPVVVLGMSPPPDVEGRLATPQPGVALLLGGADVGHRLRLDASGRLHVPGVDVPINAPGVDEREAASIDGLLSLDPVEDDGVVLDPLPTAPPVHLDLRDLPSVSELLAELDVLVRVFGPVDVVRLTADGEGPVVLPRQKSVEVVTYLACRGRGVPVEDVRDALWPSGATSLKTLQNVVTDTRSTLGAGRDGEPLLPLPEGGAYHLSRRVSSDHDVFQALVRRAGELPDEQVGDVAGLLQEALGLVAGEPFVGAARGYAWVTHQRGALVAEVVDAAEELAEIRLAEGDWRAAEWAARQGLRAFPCDERLYRLLMRAAYLAGNVAAVQRAFDELCAVVADPDVGVEPEDTVHPETLDLLEELLGGGRSRAIGA